MDMKLETEIRRLGGEGEKVAPHEVAIVDLALRLHARFPGSGKIEIFEALKSEWHRRGLSWKEA